MTAVWYYVLPMLLGRTYDMKTDTPGVDVFPQTEVDNAAAIERHFTDSQYRIVETSTEARDFLDVSGDLSLKIKSGQVAIEGLGNYLKESQSRADMVEILVKVHYETVTYTLPSTAKPVKGWKTLDRVNIGTHYVRSITYGGDLVASLKFIGKHAGYREQIRAAVMGSLQADKGSFGLGASGNFSQLQEDLKDMSTLEINYYATVPIKGIPNTLESLVELVEEFPKQTQLVNHGIGVPLRMELFPLTALDADVPHYLETRALIDQLDLLEAEFDDVRSTKTALQEWLMKVPPVLTDEIQDEIGNFNDRLEKISAVFYDVLGNLDFSEGASTEQFQPAMKAYHGEDGSLPDKFYRKFLLLKHKVVQGTSSLSLDVSGTVYTQWGKSNCTNKDSNTLEKGVIVTTDRIKGGSAEIICLKEKPKWDKDSADIKRHPRYYSKLLPVKFRGRDTLDEKQISCAVCDIGSRTSSRMFAAQMECPKEWTLEYKGYVMTKDFRSRKGDFVCVDAEAEANDQSVILTTKSDRGGYMADVKISCGTLPCTKYTKENIVPCVVCSY